MDALKLWKHLTGNFPAKLLSLAIAAVLWFSVSMEKDVRKDFTVPLRVVNIPEGLHIEGKVPNSVVLSLSGPAILFITQDLSKLVIKLDLQNTAEGMTSFPDLQKYADLPFGIRAIRVYPSMLEVKLAK